MRQHDRVTCRWCGAPRGHAPSGTVASLERCSYCGTEHAPEPTHKLEQLGQLVSAGVLSREYAMRLLDNDLHPMLSANMCHFSSTYPGGFPVGTRHYSGPSW